VKQWAFSLTISPVNQPLGKIRTQGQTLKIEENKLHVLGNNWRKSRDSRTKREINEEKAR
jgi:hypothetical protein